MGPRTPGAPALALYGAHTRTAETSSSPAVGLAHCYRAAPAGTGEAPIPAASQAPQGDRTPASQRPAPARARRAGGIAEAPPPPPALQRGIRDSGDSSNSLTDGRPLAICFDYGRTLVDIDQPGERLTDAGERVLRMLSVAGPKPLDGRESFGNRVDARVDQMIGQAHRRDPIHEVDIYEVYRLALRETVGGEVSFEQAKRACHLLQGPWEAAITVVPGVAELLPQLKARGLSLGLLSNAPYPADLMHGMLERQGLARWFEVALFSSELGFRKPAPEAFSALLRTLGVDATQSWFIGDEEDADLLGAEAVGMTAVAAPRTQVGTQSRPSLRSWADLLRRLDDLSATR
ncbi:MAG: HAD family hydrolase [Candidatus Dormibacteria bacterium]